MRRIPPRSPDSGSGSWATSRSPPPEGWDSWEAWATEKGIPEERWNDQSAIVDPDGNGPRIFFQKVPEAKAGKNRVHLDVRSAPGLDGDARRARLNERAEELVALGATRLYEMDETRRRSG